MNPTDYHTEQPVKSKPEGEQQARKGFSGMKFPSAFTVIAVVTILVWLLAFLVPSGRYEVDPDSGRPISGSYAPSETGMTLGDRLMDLFMAPINGLYGVESADTGTVGAYEAGELFGSAGVFLFVLAIGMFITVTIKSGAIEAGIGRLNERLAGRGTVLISILIVVFSIAGTTEGMAEESLGFYALVIPLALGLGYDRLTAAAIILLGAGIGTLASTINPFATGAASDAAEVSLGDGIVLRLIMFVVLTGIVIVYVVRYANRVAADPSRSMVGIDPHDRLKPAGHRAFTTGHKITLVLMALTFVFMIFAIVPWAQIINGPEAGSFAWQLDWYFPELAALFIVMAIVIGIVSGYSEEKLTSTLVAGAGDFIGAGLIIVLARGVTVIMNNAQITDTVLHAFENIVSQTPAALFAPVLFWLNIPLAFLVPSSSGHAVLAMPVLAPLADFAGLSRAIAVTAYQSASGWMNLFTPTSAVVMGGLALAKVGYGTFLRFLWPLLVILLVVISIFLVVGALV